MKFAFATGARPLDGYTIKRGIGRGGFGEVYYATSDGGKEVALKLVRRNLDVELRGVSHCLNLKHPNLLSLYDIRRDDDGDTWIVMEYVGGDSLEDVVARYPNGLPLDEALEWFRGIAAGVAYLHDRGIVHRDLKPGNVFSDEGGIKIGDYGLSKFISTSRRSGQTESVGTVHYMAPEVANGRYGKEIDIYALGIMLYEMLTGHVPFEGESVGEVLMKHLTAQPDLSRLEEPYRTVCARALDKDPEQRVSSVHEMLAALDGIAPPRPERRFAETMAYAPATAASANGAPPALPAPSPWALDQEPIYCALRESWREVNSAWEQANLQGPMRAVILVVAGLTALTLGSVILALASLYPFYYLARGFYLAATPDPVPWLYAHWSALPASPVIPAAAPRPYQPPGPPVPESPVIAQAVAPPAAPTEPSAPTAVHLQVRYERKRNRQRRASSAGGSAGVPRDRFVELLTSMLLAAGASTALVVLLSLVSNRATIENQMWLGVVSTLGSWAVLVPAKFWEGQQCNGLSRRLVMLVAGALVGAVACGLDQALIVSMSGAPELAIANHRPTPAYNAYGHPTLIGHMAFFAFLFGVLRWWRLAEPTRRHRIGLWPTSAAALWALVFTQAWPYPQPWGITVAAVISAATQLASPMASRHETSLPTVASV